MITVTNCPTSKSPVLFNSLNKCRKHLCCHLTDGYISTKCVDMDYEEVKRRFGSFAKPRPDPGLYDDVDKLYAKFPITSSIICASASMLHDITLCVIGFKSYPVMILVLQWHCSYTNKTYPFRFISVEFQFVYVHVCIQLFMCCMYCWVHIQVYLKVKIVCAFSTGIIQ